MNNLNIQSIKEFVNKYPKQVALGVVAFTFIVLYAVNRRKKVGGSVSNPKLKKVADDDQKEWVGKKETDPAVSDTLIKYWKSVGLNYSPAQMQSSSFQKANPWSASYVTHLIKSSGYNFKGGATHSSYAVQGKKDRSSGTKERYWAFRKSENKPVQIGDILVKNRDGGNYNYDTISSGVKSHGDVIVDIQNVNGKNIAYFQGGNLSNSVQRGKIELSSNNMIPSNSPYFLHLKYVR
jgi:hypothetical protein